MQRSEGGGLGVGGSSSGLMTARGASDFLTRNRLGWVSVQVLDKDPSVVVARVLDTIGLA